MFWPFSTFELPPDSTHKWMSIEKPKSSMKGVKMDITHTTQVRLSQEDMDEAVRDLFIKRGVKLPKGSGVEVYDFRFGPPFLVNLPCVPVDSANLKNEES